MESTSRFGKSVSWWENRTNSTAKNFNELVEFKKPAINCHFE